MATLLLGNQLMDKFWLTTPLAAMNQQQWESLCDGCGKCCLHKLIDDDTDVMYATNLACEFLDINTCRCRVYPQRQQKQPNCTILDLDTLLQAYWLPDSCAYRLVAQGDNLPAWHPLLAKKILSKPMLAEQVSSTVAAGQSVKEWAVSESQVPESDWQAHVLHKIPLHET